MQIVGRARVRREGLNSYEVSLFDISPHGCRLEFVDRPNVDERIFIKLDTLEQLAANVCWVEGTMAGVQFEKPIHPAVFELLLARIAAAQR